MRQFYFYLFVLYAFFPVNAQTLEWSNLFSEHSQNAFGGINPNSIVDSAGRITMVVLETDTLRLRQTDASGAVTAYLNVQMRCGNYTPLARMSSDNLGMVFNNQQGAFRYLQTDSALNIVREFAVSFPIPISSNKPQSVFEHNGELYLTVLGSVNHYLFRINPDNSLTTVYSGSYGTGQGEKLLILDNGNLVFGFLHDAQHLIRCVSPQTGAVVWEQNLGMNAGQKLKYDIVKATNNLIYAAGYERAWVGGQMNDAYRISRINAVTGAILQESAITSSIGCGFALNDFAYDPVEDKLYLSHSNCTPEYSVVVIKMDAQTMTVVNQKNFPINTGGQHPNINKGAYLHIQPDGKTILLYKSFKNSTENGNIYICPLDENLNSTGTLEINFDSVGSSEAITSVQTFDDSRIVVTGIIPNPDPFIYWEEVQYFNTMVNIDGTLSIGESNDKPSKVLLYPNPATAILNIMTPDDKVYDVTVFNATGQMVFSKEKAVRRQFVLPVAHYASGVYIVRLEGAASIFSMRFVIK